MKQVLVLLAFCFSPLLQPSLLLFWQLFLPRLDISFDKLLCVYPLPGFSKVPELDKLCQTKQSLAPVMYIFVAKHTTVSPRRTGAHLARRLVIFHGCAVEVLFVS